MKKEFKVAIIGRPNVGKSTLFNRLMGSRVAITDSQAGVTRDVVARECTLNNRKFILLDTGGLRDDAESSLEELSMGKSMEIAGEADLIVFMLDVNGLTAEDLILIPKLRKYKNKIMLVANKCDSVDKEYLAAEFYKLGLGDVYFIAAEHHRNLDFFYDELAGRIPEEYYYDEFADETENDTVIKIAVVGKPNVGKSSLANLLCGENQSIVSEIAGTTRDVIMSTFTSEHHQFMLMDTAGLRRKAKVDERIEFFSTERTKDAIKNSDVVLLMISAEEGLSDQDKKIADIIVKERKPFLFLLNKWDLCEKKDPSTKEKREKNDILSSAVDRLRFDFPVLDNIMVTAVSAKEDWGIDKLLSMVVRLYKEDRQMASELELNLALKEWVMEQAPARRGRNETWFKSLRQIDTNPPKFCLRAKGHLDDSYISYIKNRIRKEFKFNHVSLVLEIEHV